MQPAMPKNKTTNIRDNKKYAQDLQGGLNPERLKRKGYTYSIWGTFVELASTTSPWSLCLEYTNPAFLETLHTEVEKRLSGCEND